MNPRNTVEWRICGPWLDFLILKGVCGAPSVVTVTFVPRKESNTWPNGTLLQQMSRHRLSYLARLRVHPVSFGVREMRRQDAKRAFWKMGAA